MLITCSLTWSFILTALTYFHFLIARSLLLRCLPTHSVIRLRHSLSHCSPASSLLSPVMPYLSSYLCSLIYSSPAHPLRHSPSRPHPAPLLYSATHSTLPYPLALAYVTRHPIYVISVY